MDKNEKSKGISKVSSVKSALNANTKVSDAYLRKNYENKTKMDNYKKEVFGGKNTTKNFYNDDVLHLKNSPAKNKYKSNASKHQSQTDHTVPVKEVYDFASNLPNITDADIKTAVNRKHNYKVIDRKTNASKQELTNSEYIKEHPELSLKQKTKMISEGIKEDVFVKGELMVKSAGKSFADVKSYEPIVKTTISVELGQYINGEKTLAEAGVGIVKNTAKAKVDAVIMEQGISLAKTGVEKVEKQVLKAVGTEGGKKLLGQSVSKSLQVVSGHIGEIVTIAIYMGDAVIKYAKGEISAEEMVSALGETGTNLAFMQAGTIAGGLIGAGVGGFIGSIVPVAGTATGAVVGKFIGEIIGGAIGYVMGSHICKQVKMIMNTTENVETYNRLRDMYLDYAKQVEQSRKELEKYLDYVHAEQQMNIQNGFEKMRECILNDDAEGIDEAIKFICAQFSIETEYKSFDDFKNKISDKNYTFKIGADA